MHVPFPLAYTSVIGIIAVSLPALPSAQECSSCQRGPCRRMTGLFTRPFLEQGYNFVAQVPRQACNLTVREMRKSSNSLAVRTAAGYIINGKWAVVPSGKYMGAGTGFIYVRGSRPGFSSPHHPISDGSREIIYASGPLAVPVDIMVISRSRNPGIYYEYWHPVTPPNYAPMHPDHLSYGSSSHQTSLLSQIADQRLNEDIDLNNNGFNGVNFQNTWVQHGKRKLNLFKRTNHNTQRNGFLESSQSAFVAPPTLWNTRSGIANPLHGQQGQYNVFSSDTPSSNRHYGTRPRMTLRLNSKNASTPKVQMTQSFQSHSKKSILPQRTSPGSVNDESNAGNSREVTSTVNEVRNGVAMSMILSRKHNSSHPGKKERGSAEGDNNGNKHMKLSQWRVWKFTPCSRSCGGGQQEAVFICTGADGEILDDAFCHSSRKPAAEAIKCNSRPCPPTWQLNDWSQCSTTCGPGISTRTWSCIQQMSDAVVHTLHASMCTTAARQSMVSLTRECSVAPCTRWVVSRWTECSVECGTGIRSREVTCHSGDVRVRDSDCNAEEKPPHRELCHGHRCAHHTWFYTDWSEQCRGGCENGVHTRRVWCSHGVTGDKDGCPAHLKPPLTKPCSNSKACAAVWFTGPWSPCSVDCGNGTKTREVVCVVFLRGTFRATIDAECNSKTRPQNTSMCSAPACPSHWYYTDWSECSQTCGGGYRSRLVQCLDAQQRLSSECFLKGRPSTSEDCNNMACPVPADGVCVDRFRNCRLVQQTRLCRYYYYRSVCCASCTQGRT